MAEFTKEKIIDEVALNSIIIEAFPKYMETKCKLNKHPTPDNHIDALQRLEDVCWLQGATEAIKALVNDFYFQSMIHCVFNFNNRRKDAANYIYKYFHDTMEDFNAAELKSNVAIANGDDETIATIFLNDYDSTVSENDQFKAIVKKFYEHESEE